MMYARSDLRAFTPPGGVCKGHNKPADRKSRHPVTTKIHLSISCDVCEPLLVSDPLWSSSLAQVPYTDEEQRELEQKQVEGNQAMSMFSQEFLAGYQKWLEQQPPGKK
jgi:hypothetical protein